MRWVWTILIGVIVFVVVVIVGAGAALWLDGGPILAWAVEGPIGSMTGHRITLGKPTVVDWHWGQSKIVLHDVKVANAKWGTAPNMFTARRLEVDFALPSLVSGPVKVGLIEIDDGILLLETSRTGQKNWESTPAKNAVPSHGRHFPILAKFVARQCRLEWHNGRTGANDNLGIAQLVLDEPQPTDPATLVGDGTFQGRPIHIAARVGPIANLRNPSIPYPVKVRARYGLSALAINGTMAKPLDFAGLDLRISINGDQLERLASALGVPLPPLPKFSGSAALEGGYGRYALSDLALKLGQSDVQGGISVNENHKIPFLRANLRSRFLDLANFKGVYGGHPKGAPLKPSEVPKNGKVVPKAHIEVGRLPQINADLSFTGDRIANIAGTHIERVVLKLQLSNGRLTFDPLKFVAGDGAVDLRAVYAPKPEVPPRLTGTIDVRHVHLHKLLNSPAYPSFVRRTAGTVGGRVQLDSTGVSPRAILAHMTGQLTLFVQHGRMSNLLQQLVNLDILNAIGVYISGDRSVPINCGIVDFAVRQGVARVRTFLIATNQMRTTGQGTINMANETVNLTLVPRNKQFTVLTLSSPIRLTGSFKHLNFAVESGFPNTRLGRAETLAVVPPAALATMITTGLGPGNACTRVFRGQPSPQQSQAPRPKSN